MIDRPKKQKESTKKAKALRIKTMAKNLYPRLLIIGYSNVSHEIKASMEAGRVEQAESLKRQMAAATAEFAIECAKAFDSTWLKKKGQFFADQ